VHAVLDACAIIAFLRNEPGADIVRESLADETTAHFAHAVNVCEAYYILSRAGDEERVRQALDSLSEYGVLMREDMDTAFWRQAGTHKATIHRVSLADCFAVALTNRVGGMLLTSDHHEFDPLAASGVCRVRFIR
jgi:uncharacterized protein with PIN domain